MITESSGQPSSYRAAVSGRHDYYVKINLIYEKDGIIVEANLPISLEQKQIITTTCEYEVEWNTVPSRLYLYLVESESAEEMLENDPIGGSGKPQSWKEENPIKLTSCP